MKTILSIGTAITMLGVAASTVLGQTQSTTTTTTTNYIQTSKLIGTKVKGTKGDEIGEIKDVVLDQNGCMAYTVVTTGGTSGRLTGSAKTVAVPWSVYTTTSDPRVVTVRVEKEKIYNAPVFDYARINEYSTSGYITNVNSYYGVSGGSSVGVSAGVSNTNTTTANTSNTAASTTATNQNTGAVNTNPSATPALSATPMPAASATVAATATPAASVSPAPSASATASPAHSGKGKAGTADAPERSQKASESSDSSGSSKSARSRRHSDETSSEESPSSSSSHKSHHRSSEGSNEGSKSESGSTPSDEPKE